jgi:hypothetical protein
MTPLPSLEITLSRLVAAPFSKLPAKRLADPAGITIDR